MEDIFDALDSFEVREVLPQTLSTSNTQQHSQTTELMLKLLTQTTFFQSLRNNYDNFKDFTHPQLKQLFRTAQIFRIKKGANSMVISFNQPTVCIIVFGEVVVQGKTFSKGDYFIMLEGRVDIFFKHKTTLIMLHKDELENKLYTMQNYYFKKKQIESIFPVQSLQLNKQQLHQLTQKAQSLEGTVKGKPINKANGLEEGIFILFEGNFQLKMSSGICLTEIGYDYYGEQILWNGGYAFGLQALVAPYRFIFLPKKILEAVLSNKNIQVLKQLYSRKLQQRKKMAQSIAKNIQTAKRFLKKVEVANKLENLKYKQTKGKITRKPITKELVMKQKSTHMVKNQHVNLNESSIKTPQHDKDPQQQFSYTTYSNFRATLYKDQRAQSQRIFRRKISVEPGRNRSLRSSQSQRQTPKPKRIRTQTNEVDTLPKTISVLVKYYEDKHGTKLRKKQGQNESKVFLSSSKDRRILTNMKLHKQIFFRQYFELKKHEDTAFKTWR